MSITTDTQLAQAQDSRLERQFIRELVGNATYTRLGTPTMLPKGSDTKVVKWRKIDRYTVSTTPAAATQGAPVTPRQVSATDVTATLTEYKDAVAWDQFVEDTQHGVVPEMKAHATDTAVQTVEHITRNAIQASSTKVYAKAADSAIGDTNSVITADRIKYIERLLLFNKAKNITNEVMADDGVNTQPIKEALAFCIVPDIAVDTIEGITGFVPRVQFADKGMEGYLDGVFGAIGRIRFIASEFGLYTAGGGTSGGSSVAETGGNADVVGLDFIGLDAYGTVGLGTGVPNATTRKNHGYLGENQIVRNVSLNVIRPAVSSYDMTGDIAGVSWKFRYAVGIKRSALLYTAYSAINNLLD